MEYIKRIIQKILQEEIDGLPYFIEYENVWIYIYVVCTLSDRMFCNIHMVQKPIIANKKDIQISNLKKVKDKNK